MQPNATESFDLPMVDESSRLRVNWNGFSQDGSYFCVHYSSSKPDGSTSSYIACRDLGKKKWLDRLDAGPIETSPRYGPPAGILSAGMLLGHANETSVALNSISAAKSVHTLALKRQNTESKVLYTSFWPNEKRKEFARLLYISGAGELQVDYCKLGSHAAELIKTKSYELPKASSLALSPDHVFLAWSASGRGGQRQSRSITLINLTNGENVQLTTPKPSNDISTICFSSDMRYVACGCEDGAMVIWNLITKKEEAMVVGATKTISSIAFTPECDMMAYGSYDDRGRPNIWLYSIKAKRIESKWSDNPHGVGSLTFDASGSRLAVSSDKTSNVYLVGKPRN